MDYITVGSLVTYKNKKYAVVSEDFECGCNFHILGIVRINKCNRFLKVTYVEEKDDKVKLIK